jgi:putative ABC transport system ATP-binding protein
VVPQGQFVAVMGPSGSGKTTLLNCVSGLDEIDAGRVLVDGLSIHELSDKERTKHRAKAMGFIFQAFNLIRCSRRRRTSSCRCSSPACASTMRASARARRSSASVSGTG